MNLRQWFPWYLRIPVKIILSRIPVSYQLWKSLGLFEHGGMQDEKYARNVFKKHISFLEKTGMSKGFTALELGPGDSVYSAILAWAAGARRIYLVDVGDYVERDASVLHNLINNLKQEGADLPNFDETDDFSTILQRLNTTYLTGGIKDLSTIKSSTVDFIWSQAVLEHIRLNEFEALIKELKRVMTNNGIQSHRIDLKDHLGGGLENLRFSTKVWESNLMSKSGFYTNRIRYGNIIQTFTKEKLHVEIIAKDEWQSLPIKRENLDQQFAQIDDGELCISGFDVLLTQKS